MKKLNITINNVLYQVDEGKTILEACIEADIRIPTLCHINKINCIGACRICVVEVKGARSLVASCIYPISDCMEILTNTKRVFNSRKRTVELMLSDHNQDCLSCMRNQNCELQKLAFEFGCDSKHFKGEKAAPLIDVSTDYIVRDSSKCILCRRCVAVCNNLQEVAVIGANHRGFNTNIGCAFDKNLSEIACVGCGQCINVCPTGALTERSEIDRVLDAIGDPLKVVVVAPAPAVRTALGEEFYLAIGTDVEGKMISAMRRIGFDHIFDVNFAADLTIMEEGTELLDRITNGGSLPMITSCSPAWIKFMEHYYPNMLDKLSTCKSPQQMFGSVVKTYFAEKNNIDPKDLYVVSVMPCVAKKFEKNRDNQSASGYPDIDAVLTTRELAKIIKRQGIMFNSLPDGEFDMPLGIDTGAGMIFGATGGVMEAALRTVADILTGKDLQDVEYNEVRGTEGLKEATYDIAGIKVNVAAVSGLKSARILMDRVQAGETNYHFIEVMTCPGGCVNGGGQPIHDYHTRRTIDIPAVRASVLYNKDASMKLRKCHDNPVIKEIYDTYFGKPNSHKAHKILHTTYIKRDRY